MNKQFAKLYETDIGQILVTKDHDDGEGYKVTFRFCWNEDINTQIKLGFPDNESGEKQREVCFDEVTEESATEKVKHALDVLTCWSDQDEC